MAIKSIWQEIYRQQVANPSTLTTATVPATYIDAGQFEGFAFVYELGATSGGNCDMQVVQATSSGGANSKNVSGAAITQLSATDDNKQASVEVDTANLDLANGFRYVAVTHTEGGTTTGSIVFYGYGRSTLPVSQPAAFAERVIVAG